MLVIVMVLAFASYVTTYWGGSCGYDQFEFQITFKDSSGNAVEGVQLRVEDTRGNSVFCFPVTDYLPGRVPVSDNHGVMRYHHVSSGVEWDNYGWQCFWSFNIMTRDSPQYTCRFLHGEKEVCWFPYRVSPRDWSGRETVKRRWNWAEMTPTEIVPRLDETDEEYISRLRQFFHADGRHREGGIALGNWYWRYDFRRAKPVEELEFPVIERTIIVDVKQRN